MNGWPMLQSSYSSRRFLLGSDILSLGSAKLACFFKNYLRKIMAVWKQFRIAVGENTCPRLLSQNSHAIKCLLASMGRGSGSGGSLGGQV